MKNTSVKPLTPAETIRAKKAAADKATADQAAIDKAAADQAAIDKAAADQAAIDKAAADQAAIDKAAADQEQAAADELTAYYANLENADTENAAAKKEDEEEIEIELTEEDLKMNPDLVLHGLKVGDTISVPVESFAGKLSPDDQQHLEEIMAPYLETYPDEKEFHVTTDGQVFLQRNESDAKHHQKSLDPKEEVFVYRA